MVRRAGVLLALVLLAAWQPVTARAETAAGQARVTDPEVVFHRLYVEGCARSQIEKEAFSNDVQDVKDQLEAEGKEAAESTSTTLERPTIADLRAALDALRTKAKAGEEITFTFVGHGGGEGPPFGSEGGTDELWDEHIWLNCDGDDIDPTGQKGTFITDDLLQQLLRGFAPGVTLVALMDSCWGGGFTGGSSDIAEDTGTAVIGPQGECELDTQWSPFGGTRNFAWAEDTFAELAAEGAGGAADADSDGIVTADELKTWLQEEKGTPIGPPVDTNEPLAPKDGKSKCVGPTGGVCPLPDIGLSAPTVLPGGTLVVDGARFPAGDTVVISVLDPGQEVFATGEATVGDDGSFETSMELDLPVGPYIVIAEGVELGNRDHELIAVLPHGGSFADDSGSVHEGSIEALNAEDITRGCGPARFCPGAPVSRGQMAAFLVRALGLPPVTGDPFSDDDGSAFEDEIAALASAGITGGCGPGRYCPGDPVTRAQMATFLVRGLRLDGSAPDAFADDTGSIHEGAIDLLAEAGITGGCTGTRFCPTRSVARAQMASFLTRGLFLASFPPPPDIDLDGDGDGEQVTGDPTLAPGQSFTGQVDGDGDTDTVTVGTGPDGRVGGSADTDGDGEDEVVVEDPGIAGGQVATGEIDPGRDRDRDIIWVGTGGGGRTCGAGDIDGRGTPGPGPDGDDEVVVTDPTLTTGETKSANTDRDTNGDGRVDDGDDDVIWVGTKEGGTVTDIADRDGDGDAEVVFEDPTLDQGTTIEEDLDGDGDPDLIRVGTGTP